MGLYKSLNDCSWHSIGCIGFSGLSLLGAAYLYRPQCGNGIGTSRRSGCCSKECWAGDMLSCTPNREGKLQLFALALTFLGYCFCL